jgi:NAD/NADP transhydrogenase alpha subunit
MTISAIPGNNALALSNSAPSVAAVAAAPQVTVSNVLDDANASANATKGLYKGSDEKIYIDSAGLASGGNLSDSKITLTAKGKAWTAGKAEAIGLRVLVSGGYEVMLKQGEGEKAKYSVQAFDSAGVAAGKAQKLTTIGMLSAELTYDQDFSGDTAKGDVIASVVDATDGGGIATDIGLYKLASGRFAVDLENKSANASTAAGVVYLTSKGKNWTPGKSEAVAIRKTNDGFEVLLKSGSGEKTKYSVQAFNSEGVLAGKAAKLTSATLVTSETGFKQDFNADNVIGDYVTSVLDSSDSAGNNGLYRTKAGYYGVGAANLAVGSQSTLTYLESKGKVWSPGKATPVSVSVDDDGIMRVAMRSGSGAKAKVSEATFNDNGVAVGKAAAIKADQLSAKEIAYDDDLNGDSKIGNSAFKITFTYNAAAVAYKDYFISAAQRWSEIIVGDLVDVGQIDDLEISADVDTIDGAGGVLGHAGPTGYRTNGQGGLPYLGTMTFDVLDMANMQANGTLSGVILHEMGHVLGLGTLWESKGLVDQSSAFSFGGSTYYSKYTGTNALREYRTLSGNASATFIQLEDNTGVYGGGSLGAHWKESIFNSEMMTPSADIGSMPISTITVGSLKDLGYEVVLSAADPYTIGS